MQLDTLSRRSRWIREELDDEPMEITKRDIDIFTLLTRYRFLRADHIAALTGGALKVPRRLGRLYRAGYLRRPEQQRAFMNANFSSLIYENDEKAKKLVHPETFTIAPLTGGLAGRTEFPHSVMICDALASIELGVKKAGYQFITWSEILEDAPKPKDPKHPLRFPIEIKRRYNGKVQKTSSVLAPDALFGIKYASKYIFFAVECDRNNEPIDRNNLTQSSYMKKVLQYEQFIGEGLYRKFLSIESDMKILNIMSDEFHLTRVMKAIEKENTPRSMLFQHFPSLGGYDGAPRPDARLFKNPWKRIGHPDFYISKES